MNKFTIPIGPQHPLIKEPLSLNVDIEGEKVLGGQLRLGYVHRGIERLAEQRTYIQNVHLIERVCGICSHIHTTTYCYAVEQLLGLEIPSRAQFIRALLCELERIHSHMLWLGILAKHIGLDTIFMHTWHDREMVLDLMEQISGGRVSHAVNKIGGVRCDLDEQHTQLVSETLRNLFTESEKVLDMIVHDVTIRARTQDVAPLSMEHILAYCLVGPVARASGLDIDLRRDQPLPPYEQLRFKVITMPDGDAWARTVVRVEEIRQSLNLCQQIIAQMPSGPIEIRAPRKVPTGEVLLRSEAPRGELVYYVRSDGTDTPARLKIRTPSLPALSVLPLQLSEINVADIPVVVAGVDLCIACADR